MKLQSLRMYGPTGYVTHFTMSSFAWVTLPSPNEMIYREQEVSAQLTARVIYSQKSFNTTEVAQIHRGFRIFNYSVYLGP